MDLKEVLACEQIRHTISRFNRCGDNDDADGFAECFTEDGILDSAGSQLEGRAAIRAWKASGVVFKDAGSGRVAPFRVHHVSSIHIEILSETEATARSCWLVVTDLGPDHSGVYHDRFLRIEDQWLIKERSVNTLWRADNSYISPDIVTPYVKR